MRTMLCIGFAITILILGCTGPQGEPGQQGQPGPQGEPELPGELVQPGEVSELVLFPEVVMDFTVSEQCVSYIQENMSYSGTEREIADRKQVLTWQLQLPTRFMSNHPRDEHDWQYIITKSFGDPNSPESIPPECSEEAESWDSFNRARYRNEMWSWREDAMRDWWSCRLYDDNPPPTPSASAERECEILRQWIPSSWLPPADLWPTKM